MHKTANDNENCTLNVRTHSRNELIDLSKVLAYSFDRNFFQDPHNIPYILIPGSSGGGKSMIVEAMMKTLLDEYDPDDMKRPDAKQEMFLEDQPCDACHHYCQVIGHTDCAPVMYGFDRITSEHDSNAQSEFVKAFQKAARKVGAPPVGAIFTSNGSIGHTKPWLVIDLCSTGEWGRALEIKALNESLTATPQFQYYWKHLKSFIKTGAFPSSALSAYAPLPRDIFSKDSPYSEAAYNTTELLKFAFWHHDELALSKAQVAQIAASTSDLGGPEKIAPFIDWLKVRGEHDFIADIDASKSKLTRLFSKFASVDTYKFDHRKLIQYALHRKERDIENTKDRRKAYQSYFTNQLNGQDKDKIRNFLSVVSNFVADEDLEQILRKIFREPKNRHTFKSEAEERRLHAIGNLYAILDSGDFPLTIKRLNKIYRAYGLPRPEATADDEVSSQTKIQAPVLQPVW